MTCDTSHGWVRPRADGARAKCGGPGICSTCQTEKLHNSMLTACFGVEHTPSSAPASHSGSQLSSAARDVLNERQRQIDAEGWTPERDDKYEMGELSTAAGCYSMFTLAFPPADPPRHWPWPAMWWKPSNARRKNLVKAGALILAEIERLDRAAIAQQSQRKEA